VSILKKVGKPENMMGGKKGTGSKKASEEEIIVTVCRNRKATHDYEITDSLECGIVLVGSEVKSLRENPPGLDQAFARVEAGEVWLYGLEIPEYVQANQLNHKPKRRRKMLLNREEIDRFATKTTLKGSTLVPLEIYFRKGIAKVMLAVGHGKKLHDKRETLKKNEAKREIHRAMSRKRRGD
jgi:SsrA-binding protein